MAEMRKTFDFGPGTSRPRSHMRTFALPARATVGIAVERMEVTPPQERVGVTIDVFRASADSVGNTGPDGPAADDPQLSLAPSGVVPFSNKSFVSDFGCPSTWRVRVRAIDADPAARVTGSIVVVYHPADAVRLEMAGADTQHLDPGVVATRVLRPDGPGRIAGTGRFRIRAKWHADPADVLHLGSFPEMTVTLLRPDGSRARAEHGYSHHAAGKSPKIDFGYPVTVADTALTGNWGLRIANDSDIRVVDFDISRGLDPAVPTFTSTFLARCL